MMTSLKLISFFAILDAFISKLLLSCYLQEELSVIGKLATETTNSVVFPVFHKAQY